MNFGHDGSACVVKDGRLVAAIGHERIHRRKKAYGVTDPVIDYALQEAGLSVHDIDVIALSDWNREYAHGTLTATRNGAEVHCNWDSIFDNDVDELVAHMRGRDIPAYTVGHHMTHCAAAYYTSNFDEAYCFSMDASGGKLKSNCLVAHGTGNKLKALYCPGLMAGKVYGDFTEWLGLGLQMYKAGTTMALASYGQVIPRVRDNIRQYVENMYFSQEGAYYQGIMDLWGDLAGTRRVHSYADVERLDPKDKDGKRAMNIAASVQHIFEHAILHCVNNIPGFGNLCLGGGSMLNCNANTRLLQEGKFQNVHLFPGCGDDGCSVGGALYVAHHILGEPRHDYADHEVCYLGQSRPGVEPDCNFLAQELANGKIVAWFNGRSEYGPRALGSRSILADPRNFHNRELINFVIKNREWFRPLAPAVLEQDLADWFDFPTKSPYMLFTAQVKQPQAIPAVTHIDGSARMQTVRRENNPYYYDLIGQFKSRTGVPMLLNTSLNRNGEPLLESEQDAMDFWNNVPVDYMVLDGKIYQR